MLVGRRKGVRGPGRTDTVGRVDVDEEVDAEANIIVGATFDDSAAATPFREPPRSV
jgi:hypothetical protein